MYNLLYSFGPSFNPGSLGTTGIKPHCLGLSAYLCNPLYASATIAIPLTSPGPGPAPLLLPSPCPAQSYRATQTPNRNSQLVNLHACILSRTYLEACVVLSSIPPNTLRLAIAYI